MKIISYSDLHLEFGSNFRMPETDADLLVLAGDITVLPELGLLHDFLKEWDKPALYVLSNHEHYTGIPMASTAARLNEFLTKEHPNVRVLQDEAVTIGGVNFFGGTMWTDFDGARHGAMSYAHRRMNDYNLICTGEKVRLKPGTVEFHKRFVQRLVRWLETDLSGLRVVITHHAPVEKPYSQYAFDDIRFAFRSFDMMDVISKFQPELWIYGHTHECDDQKIGKTRVISNSLGYPLRSGGFECEGFDPDGCPVRL